MQKIKHSIKKSVTKEMLFDLQSQALRDPAEIITQTYERSGLTPKVLQHKTTPSFVALLHKLDVTLFVTREYEHLVLALGAGWADAESRANKVMPRAATNRANTALRQSFVHLPHPSGLAVDHKKNAVYIAATRNPNQLWEFKPLCGLLPRGDRALQKNCTLYLMPTRTKFLSGAYYMHDLAIIDGKIYGNSVGQNAIVQIDFAKGASDKLVWWPKSINGKGGKPQHHLNFLQLNSIAAGTALKNSFFSASAAAPGKLQPGHPDFPVDKTGVIFSGRTRDVCGHGLTRPHSARLYRGRLYVDNSGYGEFGYMDNGKFHVITKLPGWTRGLVLINDIAFVGVSRVLPRFRQYAPGVRNKKQVCGIFAIDLNTGQTLGSLTWPYGNQIFTIDWIDAKVTPGFPFTQITKTPTKIADIFYSYHY